MRAYHKSIGVLFLISLIFLSVFPTSLVGENTNHLWWNEDWSYRQKLILPINTSDKELAYHPIDLLFEFENACWAKNEKEHSVRVIKQQNGRFKELESQIYNLNYSDDNQIQSCGLVFLIHKDANGEEEYYVYYNNKETSAVDYADRVSVEDSYFSYEPIRGVKTETWTYNIIQGENTVYSIVKEGKLGKTNICQQIVKLKEGAKSLFPNLGDHTLSYAFYYKWFENDRWFSATTADKLVTSKIYIDGNLMVKVGLISESEEGMLRSTALHKYYYCPRENKSLYSNVKHEVKETIPEGKNAEAFFVSSINGVLKSSIIKELDYGRMPKYLHFYSDEERIKTHEFDPYPESAWEEIIGREEDYTLGSIPWISVDGGKTGMAHGIILDSENVLSPAETKEKGIQISLYQSNYPKLPGLDGRTSFLYLGRNFYQSDGVENDFISDDYTIEFKSLYYSTEKGGYKDVERKAELYQTLIDYQPTDKEIIFGEETNEEFNLTVFTHIPLNLITKMIGSKFLLKNSYFRVEIVYDESVIGFKPSVKIPLVKDFKIDWGNISLFRSATFSHLKPRKYIVKVYLLNPFLGNEKEFIGFDVIDLEKDTETHIRCRAQGEIKLQFNDQDGNGVADVKTVVLKEDTVIQQSVSDSNGKNLLGLPLGLKTKYIVKSFYKGFLVDERQIKLSFLNNLISVKKTVDLELYDFKVGFFDSNEKTPDFDLEINLNSEEMQDPLKLKADSIENGVYFFNKLIPAEYKFNIEYESTKATKNIRIPDQESLLINLYDLTFNLRDLWGFPTKNNETLIYVKNSEYDSSFIIYAEKITDGTYKVSNLYPGNYSIIISYRSTILKHNISVPAENEEAYFVFPVLFNITGKVFDTHGNPLQNVDVKIKREDEEVSSVTSDNGSFIFSIPPGEYTVKIFDGEELISQRKVDMLNGKKINIVTNKDPWQPYAITIAAIMILIAAGIVSYKHRKKIFFLKILSITLVIMALVAPWWSINGTSTNPHLETWTKLYITPNKIITLTENKEVIAGDIATMDQVFISLMEIIFYISISAICLITANILFKKFTKFRKIKIFTLFLSLVLMMGVNIVFYFTASMFSSGTIGSLFGSGALDIVIYGENVFEQINCSWGLNIGFFMFLFSTSVVLILFLYCIKEEYKTKN